MYYKFWRLQDEKKTKDTIMDTYTGTPMIPVVEWGQHHLCRLNTHMIRYAVQVNGGPPLQKRFNFIDIERLHLNFFFREELSNVIWLQTVDALLNHRFQ